MDKPGSKNLQLLFGGDVMLGRAVNKIIQREGPAYPFEPIVSLTRPADLFFVNLECAFSKQKRFFSGESKQFYFRAEPGAVEALTYSGVDLVSLANNHALDANYDGLRDTMTVLRANDIAFAGAGENIEAASQPAFLESKGQKIGVLAYCDHQADFAATTQEPGIRYVDVTKQETRKALTEEVKSLSRQVDHVVVAFHWQPNWVRKVSRLCRVLAQKLVEAGARIIWGHSPHHFLGVEWIGDGVVLYSTGGLLDDYAVDPRFRNDRQLLFCVELSRKGVEHIRSYPLQLEFARTDPAQGEARKWIETRFKKMCREFGEAVVHKNHSLEVLQKNKEMLII